MSRYEKIAALGIVLPEVAPSVAAYVPFVRSGNQIFVSGHIAKKNGKPWVGQLDLNVTTEQGITAARGVAKATLPGSGSMWTSKRILYGHISLFSRYASPGRNEVGPTFTIDRFYSANRWRSTETLVAGQERLVVCRSAHACKQSKRGR